MAKAPGGGLRCCVLRCACLLAGLLAGLLAALPATPALAQRVQAYVSADSVRVGDRFFLSLVAEHDPLAAAAFPEPTDSLRFGDLEVLTQSTRAAYDRGPLRVDSVVYEVTTFALDTAFVPPIAVRFTADADTFRAAAEAFTVPVVSLVPPDAQDVRDLAPIVDFPRSVWPWVLLGAVVLAVTALLGYLYWKRRKSRPAAAEPAAPARVLSPYEEAAERLNTLETYDLDDPAAIKPYYVELSDLLRLYLARRTGINAMECTSRELIRAMVYRGTIPAEATERARVVLDLSDLVKFADARPPTERSRAALADTRETIERIEQAQRRDETTVRQEGPEPPGRPRPAERVGAPLPGAE